MSDLNVGNFDRMLRITFGVTLVGLASSGTLGAWGWVGAVPLLTGLSARCPLYALARLRTTSR
jgi:hypothetical protein